MSDAARSIRFRPPAVEHTAELAWALRRAFAAPGSAPPPGVDLPAAVTLARRLGLGARLGARGADIAELAGSAELATLRREAMLAAASELRGLAAARAVAAAVAAEGERCCLLKGAALGVLAVVPPGSRPLADVDLLVPAEAAERIAARLVRGGFCFGGEEYPHQLPALGHPQLGSVELHRHLPGVRLAGGRGFATLAEIERAGLVEAWGGEAPGAQLPSRELLLAHLLAHALGQHAFRPAAYPPLRLIGDLLDLGIAGADGPRQLAGALPLLDAVVPAAEARAAAAVACALSAGRSELLEDDSAAGQLLCHLLAGVLDAGYREALKLTELSYPLAAAGRRAGRWAALGRALLLSRSQIDAIYGRPRHPWGYAARRMLRPFDLLSKVLRAMAATRGKR